MPTQKVNLQQLNLKVHHNNKYWPENSLIFLQKAVLEKLSNLEDSVFHVDLKPENILILMNDTSRTIEVELNVVNASDNAHGTLAYLAPERYKISTTLDQKFYKNLNNLQSPTLGNNSTLYAKDHTNFLTCNKSKFDNTLANLVSAQKSNIFSLGLLIYELATFSHPFGRNINILNEVDFIWDNLFEKEEAVIEELENFGYSRNFGKILFTMMRKSCEDRIGLSDLMCHFNDTNAENNETCIFDWYLKCSTI